MHELDAALPLRDLDRVGNEDVRAVYEFARSGDPTTVQEILSSGTRYDGRTGYDVIADAIMFWLSWDLRGTPYEQHIELGDGEYYEEDTETAQAVELEDVPDNGFRVPAAIHDSEGDALNDHYAG